MAGAVSNEVLQPSKKGPCEEHGQRVGGNYRWVAILAQETGAGVLPAEQIDS